MDHLVQFTISIDDAHIAQMVEERAANELKEQALKVVKSTVGEPDNYWNKGMSEKGLQVVRQFLDENRDYIVAAAAKDIADRVMRSKKMKDRIVEETK